MWPVFPAGGFAWAQLSVMSTVELHQGITKQRLKNECCRCFLASYGKGDCLTLGNRFVGPQL